MENNESLQNLIKTHCLIELFNDIDSIKICSDECEVVGDKLHISEDPIDDIDLKYITKVWHFNEKTDGFDLVYKREHTPVPKATKNARFVF